MYVAFFVFVFIFFIVYLDYKTIKQTFGVKEVHKNHISYFVAYCIRYIGTFENENEAAAAYDAVAKELTHLPLNFGNFEYAHLYTLV